MMKKILKIGDKVDFQLVQQLEQAKKTGATVKTYTSQVTEVVSEDELEITMPMEQGKMIVLPLGVRLSFVFSTARGMYQCVGQIKERYKKRNMFLYLIEIHSQLKKCQRREYYRYSCQIACQYVTISKEDAEKKTTEALIGQLSKAFANHEQKEAVIQDLSGGGVKMIGDVQLEQDSYILLYMRLTNDKLDRQYTLASQVLHSQPVEDQQTKFESRVQFIFNDDKTREEIIRYIFEEERKGRKIN